METVPIRGRLRFGDQPVRARLTFGGSEGDERIRLYSSSEGLFEGLLPSPGTWPISLLYRRDGAQHHIEPVEIALSPGATEVWLELTVPPTEIKGWVVDEQGSPIQKEPT
jgi:hypothetical protein